MIIMMLMIIMKNKLDLVKIKKYNKIIYNNHNNNNLIINNKKNNNTINKNNKNNKMI